MYRESKTLSTSHPIRRRVAAGIAMSTAAVVLAAATATSVGAGWSSNHYVNGSDRLSAQRPTGYVATPKNYELPAGGSVDVNVGLWISNPTDAKQSVPIYFTVWHILTCESGFAAICTAADISDGKPGKVTEAQFSGHWKQTTQERGYPAMGSTIDPPSADCTASKASCFITLDGHTSKQYTFTADLKTTGYFQFDLASTPWPCGHHSDTAQSCKAVDTGFALLSTGFVRVLAAPEATPTPSPSPSPSPSFSGGVHGATAPPSSGAVANPVNSGVRGASTTAPTPTTGAAGDLVSAELTAVGALGSAGLLLLGSAARTLRRRRSL